MLDGNGSAGDFPFGYRSEYVDPQKALSYHGRGPKPGKKVVIDEASARVVQDIMERFGRQGQSMTSIVQFLNQIQGQIPRPGKGLWHHQHIRRILSNEKYIGRWVFGRTTTLRDGAGKKKQVAARSDQKVVKTERPDLRLVEQELWDDVQKRLGQLADIYGLKRGGKRRGPAEYYRLLYSKRPIDGIVFCSLCGSRMVSASSSHKKALGCPKRRAGTCPMTARVDYGKAHTMIMKIVEDLLLNEPDWIEACVTHMQSALHAMAKASPDELAVARSNLDRIDGQINNLIDALAGGGNSPAIHSRLATLEGEKRLIQSQVAELESVQRAPFRMPDPSWIRQQLAELGHHLQQEAAQVAPVIRAMLGKITAEEIKASGKRRGFIRLRFRIDGWEALSQVLAGKLPDSILHMVKPVAGEANRTEEFVVDLGAPTRLDGLAPRLPKCDPPGSSGRRSAGKPV